MKKILFVLVSLFFPLKSMQINNQRHTESHKTALIGASVFAAAITAKAIYNRYSRINTIEEADKKALNLKRKYGLNDDEYNSKLSCEHCLTLQLRPRWRDTLSRPFDFSMSSLWAVYYKQCMGREIREELYYTKNRIEDQKVSFIKNPFLRIKTFLSLY